MPARPTALLGNPYVLAFLVGCITLTLIRPLLRWEPKPPPVLSQLPVLLVFFVAQRFFVRSVAAAGIK